MEEYLSAGWFCNEHSLEFYCSHFLFCSPCMSAVGHVKGAYFGLIPCTSAGAWTNLRAMFGLKISPSLALRGLGWVSALTQTFWGCLGCTAGQRAVI